MPTRRLPNYLRSARKRCGLSQKELAYLLGVRTSGNISRYERFARVPSLTTALRMQAVLGIPAHELFAGIFAAAQEQVAARAHQLLARFSEGPQSPLAAHKRHMLEALAGEARHSQPTTKP